jgi:hypothetical protein
MHTHVENCTVAYIFVVAVKKYARVKWYIGGEKLPIFL